MTLDLLSQILKLLKQLRDRFDTKSNTLLGHEISFSGYSPPTTPCSPPSHEYCCFVPEKSREMEKYVRVLHLPQPDLSTTVAPSLTFSEKLKLGFDRFQFSHILLETSRQFTL